MAEEWTLQDFILICTLIHFVLHFLKTVGNRILKFLYPHLIPMPRTPVVVSLSPSLSPDTPISA